MKKVLFSDDIIPVVPESETANPFISELERNMKRTAGQIANYSGIYMSYSVSSGSLAMKLEPYIIRRRPTATTCSLDTTTPTELHTGVLR